MCRYLSEEPVELHAFCCSIAALNEARSAVHIHQALVVVIVNGGTEEPDVQLLCTGVIDILQKQHILPWTNWALLYGDCSDGWDWHLGNGFSRAAYEHIGNKLCSKWGFLLDCVGCERDIQKADLDSLHMCIYTAIHTEKRTKKGKARHTEVLMINSRTGEKAKIVVLPIIEASQSFCWRTLVCLYLTDTKWKSFAALKQETHVVC